MSYIPSYEYIAGFIDGEGHIRLSRRKNKHYISGVIGITNTNKAILESIQSVIGGKIEYNKPAKAHWKPGYVLKITGKKVLEVLDKVYPYLIIKKQQAKTVQDFYAFKACFSTMERTMLIDSYRTLRPEIIATELIFFNRIADLNRKGVVEVKKDGEKDWIERQEEKEIQI